MVTTKKENSPPKKTQDCSTFEKIGRFIDEHVELGNHTREEAIALFSYIHLLFTQGREEEIQERFLTPIYFKPRAFDEL